MSVAKEQALLNEYKGNLFEFLVANYLAEKFGISDEFQLKLTDDYRHMLQVQQKHLLLNYPKIYKELPLLAKKMKDHLCLKLNIQDVKKISVIGKYSQSGTADILIEGAKDHNISLKLGKKDSFVNTKSAGIQSFFSKYFSYTQDKMIQGELNEFLEREYSKMALEMNESVGILGELDFKTWNIEERVDRPGLLNEEQKNILYGLYYRLSQKINELFLKVYSENPKEFKKSLLNLMGFSDRNITQASCYHFDDYRQANFEITSYKLIEKRMKTIEIEKSLGERAYFSVNLNDCVVQLRVKPMNSFTVKGFKVNCAYKLS